MSKQNTYNTGEEDNFVFPASFAQQRMWFLDQWEPDKATYVIALSRRLQGPLRVEVLEQSLHALLQRHEGLRTHFMLQGEDLVQVIAQKQEVPLPLFDLSGLGTDQQQCLRHLRQQEAMLAFELSQGPLLRVRLLRLSPQDHILLLSLHHIIADGWSVGIVQHDLEMLYEAGVRNVPATLAPLPLQYADYALWQRQWLQGDVLEHQLAYWRRELAGAPTVLELPGDHSCPDWSSPRGASHRLQLSPTLSQQLKAVSQQQGVTPFMTLLAALLSCLLAIAGKGRYCWAPPLLTVPAVKSSRW